jgi:hypothetical protein
LNKRAEKGRAQVAVERATEVGVGQWEELQTLVRKRQSDHDPSDQQKEERKVHGGMDASGKDQGPRKGRNRGEIGSHDASHWATARCLAVVGNELGGPKLTRLATPSSFLLSENLCAVSALPWPVCGSTIISSTILL